ncbi:hypothetical protein P4S72_29010 [Vibrio sp. PP-XX7]
MYRSVGEYYKRKNNDVYTKSKAAFKSPSCLSKFVHILGTVCVMLALSVSVSAADLKPRVINTTDIGDPDDTQSMVRQLVMSNEFDLEGLIVATGAGRSIKAQRPH